MTDDTPFNERPTAVINEFNDEVAREFRANGGEVGGQFAGVPILLLTNTGAKSGQQRLNPLAYFNIDGKIYIVGSFGGADKDPPGCTTCARIHMRISTSVPTDTT